MRETFRNVFAGVETNNKIVLPVIVSEPLDIIVLFTVYLATFILLCIVPSIVLETT